MAVFHPVFSLLSDFPSIFGSSPVGVEGGARGFPCDRCCRLLLRAREIHSVCPLASVGLWDMVSSLRALCSALSASYLPWWIYWAQAFSHLSHLGFFLVETDRLPGGLLYRSQVQHWSP